MGGRFVSDFGNFTAALMQAGGRIVKAVNDQLEREANEIARIARLMAPREFGVLERSIKVASSDRRRKWAVYVDDDMPRDPRKGAPGTVGSYLRYAHDLNQGLGPASMAKAATSPYRVGLKFMDRALQVALRNRALQRVENAARRALRS